MLSCPGCGRHPGVHLHSWAGCFLAPLCGPERQFLLIGWSFACYQCIFKLFCRSHLYRSSARLQLRGRTLAWTLVALLLFAVSPWPIYVNSGCKPWLLNLTTGTIVSPKEKKNVKWVNVNSKHKVWDLTILSLLMLTVDPINLMS